MKPYQPIPAQRLTRSNRGRFAPRSGAPVCMVGWLVLFLGVSPGFGAAEMADHDEEFLKENKLATDGASLLAFLRQQFPERADPSKTDQFIQQLGDGEFAQREEASRLLVAIGPTALLALQQAIKHHDLEVARRAKECIQQINHPSRQVLAPAVARLLVKKQPPGCVAAVLRYLPYAVDEETTDEICFGLEVLLVQKGKLDPVLISALNDPFPVRRAVAGCLAGSHGSPEERTRVRKLWTDSNPSVRLRSAQGLLAAGEKAAIPVLIGLLEGVSTDVAWQAEELLHWVACEAAPDLTIGSGSPKACKACRTAWANWWQQKNDRLDLGRIDPRRRKPGLCMIITDKKREEQADDDEGLRKVGCVCICGCDGKARWQLDNLSRLYDVHWLPSNRVLLAESSNRIGVTERDLDGTILWQFKGIPTPWSCQRLVNGNTCIIQRSVGFIEVTPEGQSVFSFGIRKNRILERGKEIEPLRNRRFFCRVKNAQGIEELVEFDPFIDPGRILRRLPLPVKPNAMFAVQSLPDGHYLVAQKSAHKIWEIDRVGKVVWQWDLPAWYSTRLPDGNVLAVFQKGLAEMNPTRQMVWEILIKDWVRCVRPCLNLVRLGFLS